MADLELQVKRVPEAIMLPPSTRSSSGEVAALAFIGPLTVNMRKDGSLLDLIVRSKGETTETFLAKNRSLLEVGKPLSHAKSDSIECTVWQEGDVLRLGFLYKKGKTELIWIIIATRDTAADIFGYSGTDSARFLEIVADRDKGLPPSFFPDNS